MGCRLGLIDLSVDNDDVVAEEVNVGPRDAKCEEIELTTDRPSSNGSSLEEPSSGEMSDTILAMEAEDVIRPAPTVLIMVFS
jgi:hypothetical protein